MGTTALRQFLKSLCSDSPWKYTVLWKLRHGNPTILTWEDGCCASPRPSESMNSICTSEMISSYCASFIHDGDFGECPIGTVLVNMSRLQHPWGEGVIGKVAYTGQHLWISCEDIFTDKLDSLLVSECPEEWLCQFALGIKTIVLVPVLPHGVLQLGSMEMVAEHHSAIACIRNRFITYSAGSSTGSISFNSGTMSQLSSSLKTNLVERFDQSSVSSISPKKSEDSSDSLERKKIMPIISDGFLPLLDLKSALHVSGKQLPEIYNSVSGNDISVSPVGFSKTSSPLNQSTSAWHLDMEESKLFSSPEEESGIFPACNGSSLGSYAEFPDGVINANAAGVLVQGTQAGQNISVAGPRTLSSSLCFPKDCELHKALGAAITEKTNQHQQDPSVISEDIFSTIYGNATDNFEFSFMKGSESGYLLEAVVANLCSCTDYASHNSNLVKSSVTLLGEISATSHPQSSRDDSVCLSQGTCDFSDGIKKDFTTSDSTTFGSAVSSFFDVGKGDGLEYRKAAKILNGGRRRARPGDNQRPRPRDRQMIQDRVKELRELVPNGAKCSIDGLLERTIKHMLYLKSVTKQVEKLKHWVDHENFRSTGAKENSQFGTSWAFEIGGEQLLCPIIVEDLPHPGHMLIEMLCNEHGLFLDIAQAIRSLDLTILKGVMEARSNNKWARFIIEGSKGFHRLDIFWPLMQLSQRSRHPISSKI